MRIKKADKAWLEFVRWCRGHGLKALPAHPWTLAAYARWCEQRLKYPQIARHVIVIARAHLMACVPSPDRDPIVARTLSVMEERHRAPPLRAALFNIEPSCKPRIAKKRTPQKQDAEPAKRQASRPPRLLRTAPRLASRRPDTP